jgi:hypothetical protein
VGVVEARDGLRFAFEAAQEVGGLGEVRVEDFDSDEAVEAGVVGFVNLGHAAAPEALLQLVFAEGATGEVGHGGDYRRRGGNDKFTMCSAQCTITICEMRIAH